MLEFRNVATATDSKWCLLRDLIAPRTGCATHSRGRVEVVMCSFYGYAMFTLSADEKLLCFCTGMLFYSFATFGFIPAPIRASVLLTVALPLFTSFTSRFSTSSRPTVLQYNRRIRFTRSSISHVDTAARATPSLAIALRVRLAASCHTNHSKIL